MATPEEIAAFRRIIAEPDTTTYSDDELSARIDAADSDDALARDIWAEKAASYSGLIDIQEGNSKRAMSTLYKNALAMSSEYGTRVDAVTVTASRRTRMRPIDRV